MLKQELEELFGSMSKVVREKLKPVMDNLLERAQEHDEHSHKDREYYDEERELIMKEVHKVKYLNDQWYIMNGKKNN